MGWGGQIERQKESWSADEEAIPKQMPAVPVCVCVWV